MADMIADDMCEPIAVAGDPLLDRQIRGPVRKRLGDAMGDGAVRAQLDDRVGSERLQLGEDTVVADRKDVEREFVQALGIEAEPWLSLRGGEQGGREEPQAFIVEDLEGREIVGQKEGPVGLADDRRELAAEPRPVELRWRGGGEQGLQRRPADQPVERQ